MTQHELLAIEGNRETQVAKVRSDLVNTFEKKRHLFEEKRTLFTPNEEGAPQITEHQSDIQSTIRKELEWIRPHFTKLWDAEYQIEQTNTKAKADVVLEDGTILAAALPATFLLQLQKRLAELMHLAQAIPTLDPAKGFVEDRDRGEAIYKAREVRKKRTTKKPQVIVKYDATKEHPAQTELYNADVEIGTIEEQEWSGLLTPAEKAAILARIEELTRAVRSARSRANDEQVDKEQKVADRLLKYVFG